jgi:glycosyltransferase involved in cell wall biosynthesis
VRTVEATAPDVIHVNSSHIWLVLTLPILAKRHPVVATVHDVHPHPGQDDTLRKRLERRIAMKRADRIFVHGEKIKQQLLEMIPSRSPGDVHVTPLGEFSFFTKWVSDIEREDSTVLFFGRMRDYKGLRYLVDAAPKVAQRVPRAKFIIAGEGSLGRDGNRLKQEPFYEVHNRYIPDEEVAGFFQRASLVVLPYVEASQSGIIPIAFAFRLPVVATSVGCLSDVVEEGVTGLLVPPRDSDALADAIVEMLQDKAKRVEMGENGYKKLNAELGWDNIARRTLRVYEELVEGRKREG